MNLVTFKISPTRWLVVLIKTLTILASTTSNAYIVEIATLKKFDPATNQDKYVHLMGDAHDVGDKITNREQRKFFNQQIVKTAWNSKIKISVLFENFAAFDLLTFPKNEVDLYQAFRQFYFPIHFNNSYTQSSRKMRFESADNSWIDNPVFPFLRKRFRKDQQRVSEPKYLRIKSIDPRGFIGFIWNDSLGSLTFNDFKTMLVGLPEFDHCVVDRPSCESLDEISTIIKEYEESFSNDLDYLLEEMTNKPAIEMAPHFETPMKRLLESHVVTTEILKKSQIILEANPMLFGRSLDRIAFWESVKPTATSHTFVLAGLMHTLRLEQDLLRVGFQVEERSKNVVERSFEGVEAVFRFEPYSGDELYKKHGVPTALKDAIQEGMLSIKSKLVPIRAINVRSGRKPSASY